MLSKTLWIATDNQGKKEEFKSLLGVHSDNAPKNIQLHFQSEKKNFFPRPETGQTFAENAWIKTKALYAVLDHNTQNQWVLGDDSGLIIPGLNGMPGVHSARYAGPKASMAENITKVLHMIQLRCASQRQAKLTAHLAVLDPTGNVFDFTGEISGMLSESPCGDLGFGYDSIFIPDGYNQTLAELGAALKNQISHRAQAFHKFLEIFERQMAETSPL